MMNLDQTFAALSDPTRRAILARLANGPVTVGELAAPFEISLPAISRHLKVLEEAALIVNSREGKHRRCSLDPRGLQGAGEWLDFYRRFWGGAFDRLNEHLKRKTESEKP
jgi:DNA-binding transcriptional ArsR family regulator